MPQWITDLPSGVESAIDVFIGYVMLDTWIANQDRHHENWGALWTTDLSLAPTFDHGAALGRNLTDEERHERLSTNDRNRTVAAFAQRARSAFYRSEADKRPLGILEAFLDFGECSSAAKQAWINRLSAVKEADVSSILDRVPPERMSPVCREFTLALLNENQHRLLDAGIV